MKYRVSEFVNKITDETEKAKKYPLENAKYRIAKQVYGLTLFLQEMHNNPSAYRLPAEDENRNFHRVMVGFIDASIKLLRDIDTLTSIDELSDLVENYITVNCSQLCGYVNMQRHLNFCKVGNDGEYFSPLINNYRDYDDDDLESIDNFSNALDGLYSLIATHIKTHRDNLNLFTGDLVFNTSGTADINNMMLLNARVKQCFNEASDSHSVSVYSYIYNFTSYIYAQENPEIYDKIITGDSNSVRIGAEFDLGLSTFRYATDFCYTNPSVSEINKNGFLKMHSRIKKGGVEILVLPKIFLSYNMLAYLEGYLNNIQIFQTENFLYTGFIGIVGTKKINNDPNITIARKLMSDVLESTHDKTYTDYYINLPAPERITFRSTAPERSEIIKALTINKSFLVKNENTIFKAVGVDKEYEEQTPILPFNSGQLGLVLCAGLIDGICDEGDGIHYHVIKGSCYKTTNTVTDQDSAGHRITTVTTGNGTAVTMLTADGVFHTLR